MLYNHLIQCLSSIIIGRNPQPDIRINIDIHINPQSVISIGIGMVVLLENYYVLAATNSKSKVGHRR